jgi:alpha-N-acetylglucosamine transferase
VVLVSDIVSTNVINLLGFKKITFKRTNQINNRHKLDTDYRQFKYMFTKLRIFETFEFNKIVYPDADMLICDNIEDLFNYPHMSAVVAGGLNPGSELGEILIPGL